MCSAPLEPAVTRATLRLLGRSNERLCLENKLILCSYSDGFVMEQDACTMCGSFEPDQEGRLISCPQCEQVYFFFLVNNMEIVSSLALFLIQCHHPFCANVRLTKVIYKKDDVASISNSLTNSILCDVLLTMCNFFFTTARSEDWGERHD